MRIETAIIQKLETLGALTALVGSRISVDDIEQDDELPAVVVIVADETPQDGELDLDGQNDLWQADVDIEVYARSRTEARAVEAAIRDNGTDPGTGLNGFSGSVSEGSFKAAHIGSEASMEAPQNEEGSPKYLQTSTYLCQYNQTNHGY